MHIKLKINIFVRRLVQDGRVEGHALPPSCKSTRTIINCWTFIERKTLELTKKDTPHPETKEKPQWDGRRGVITIKSNPISARWVTHKLENNFTTEVHPLERRFWAPHRASQPGGPAMGGGIPRESDFEGWWDLIAGIWQDLEKQRLHSWRPHTKVVCASGCRGKEQWPRRRLNHTYQLVLEGLLQSRGVAVAHHRGNDTGRRSSGKYSLAWALPKSMISPTKEPVASTAGSPKAKNPTEGTQPHPSADKWIKVLLISAHQSNTQLYHHQSLPSGSLDKPHR